MVVLPKVLVIAEAANPGWVSVPLLGWSLTSALNNVADVHLVTQVRNKRAILGAGLAEGADFTAIDSETVSRPLTKCANFLRMGKGKGWTMITAANAIAYPYFEHLVWEKFGAKIQAGEFDIVHRITPLSPTIHSPIASKCAAAGVPFIIGPLNGGVPWPPGFDGERRREREWLSYVRGAYKMLPGRSKTLDAASAIIVGSRHTEEEIPKRFAHKLVYIPENAIDPEKFNLSAPQHVEGPLNACFVGRLVPYKGPDMLLNAAESLLRDGRMKLDIVGDGPLRQELMNQVNQKRLSDAVKFLGNLEHKNIQEVMARANIFPFPSIREFGGGVVLEAMSLGVVPIVVDYAGPGELVTEETGYKIQLGSKEEIIGRLSRVLNDVADDRSKLANLSLNARTRALEEFTWAAKAQQIQQVYAWVLGDRVPRPNHFETK